MKKTLITSILLLFALVLPAKTIKGTVNCGDERLGGVIVTDGCNFALTDKNGRFRIKADPDADFIYIVTPAGYVAPFGSGTPEFFRPLDSEDFDFRLIRTSDSEDYAIIALADPQTAHEKHFARFAEDVMPDIRETIAIESRKANTIGITLGDICWDNTPLLSLFKETYASTGIPFYPVIGNHDHLKDLKGDHATSTDYRRFFGPENYAFCIGGDYVIVLDNVEYDTQKQYVEGYVPAQLEWVKKLLAYIPASSRIYIAQHCPFVRWFMDGSYLNRGEQMLEILKGRQVTILSGHTHINNNTVISGDVMEFNIAAACGTWWSTAHANDGTPGGYKVFEKKDGELAWYYKSTGKERGFQMETYNMGQSAKYPNAVVANVWDYDPQWKVEWYEDGKAMGAMKQVYDYSPVFIWELNAVYADRGKATPTYKLPRDNNHYFIAVPDRNADEVTVVVTDRFGNEYRDTVYAKEYVDVQAHRGGAGLMPENTISAMRNAIDMGVNTLELDLQISADKKVVVSHDAYFHPRYATRPDGSIVQKSDPKEYIYTMPYSEVKEYDTGMRPSEVWPEKANIAECKPLAEELIDFVEKYTADNNLSPMRYNIEIKSMAGEGEGTDWPEYHEFTDLCVELLLSKGLGDRLVVQSFDTRALNYMHEKYPELTLSYLVDSDAPDFGTYMSLISFTPEWLSPHHSIIDEDVCRKAAEYGMKLVPWTVDRPEDIRRMISLGVEAIISNYPDRVLKETRGYSSVIPPKIR